jgi:hypothetical protein
MDREQETQEGGADLQIVAGRQQGELEGQHQWTVDQAAE